MLAEVAAKQNLFFAIMGEITVSHDDIDNNMVPFTKLLCLYLL